MTYFTMDIQQFESWACALIDDAYDWKQIGISDEYCNRISIPNYGLELINWPERVFCVKDEKKYMMFLLRHS